MTELTALDVNFAKIQSLEGAQYFTGLRNLKCLGNQLTALDVSKNTRLTSLYCQKNQLTRLDMRGVRSLGRLNFHQATSETNVINMLKVHENLKNHAQIKALKTDRGDEVKIETYSADAGSTAHTAICNDYDPTKTNEQDRCKEELP